MALTLLEKVQNACRVGHEDPDINADYERLINAAKLDLKIAGVELPAELDALVEEAIITYCKLNAGVMRRDDAERLKRSYDEQKAQLSNATGYTLWEVV